MTFAELKALIRPAGPEEPPAATLVIDDEATVADALEGVIAYFGEDSSRRAIRLVVEGEEVGYLGRTDLYAHVAFRDKGLDDAAHAGLPGQPRYRTLRLRCPVAGCPASPVLSATYDEDDPPSCPEHAGQLLELER